MVSAGPGRPESEVLPMSRPASCSRPVRAQARTLHARFLALLPRLEAHGRVYFRHLRCPDRKAEALQEMRALAWKWVRRLAERGRDPFQFPSALATFAARAVASGRRLVGQESPRDVLSPHAQRRRGIVVRSLPDGTPAGGHPLAAALRDNTRTPVPDQVQFRVDFPRWRETRNARDRRLIDRMMHGARTSDLSEALGISPARVSQLRREYHEDWQRFCGVGVEDD